LSNNIAARRGVRGATIVLVVIVVGVVAALGWLVSLPSADERLAVATQPVIVPVADGPRNVQSTIELIVTLSGGGDARAPDWQGLVTSVLVKPGDTMSTGSPIVEVDGVRRVAAATPRPFYRSLTLGDVGPDVDQLVAFLTAIGKLPPDRPNDRPYDQSLGRAVKALAADLGIREPDDKSWMDFDNTWVVWMPGENLLVDEVRLTVGTVAPSLGEVLLTFRSAVTSVRFAVGVPALTTEGVSDEVTVNGLVLPVTNGEIILDDQSRDELASLLSSATDVADSASEIEHQASQGNDREISINAVRSTTFDVATQAVPVAAVVTSLNGGQWVLVPGQDGYEGVPVVVVASETARSLAFVRGLDDVAEVVGNPGAAQLSEICSKSGE
jgi:hypothetical protein